MSEEKHINDTRTDFISYLRAERQKLIAKWERTGLLEGLSDTAKRKLAVLLENQSRQLVFENEKMKNDSYPHVILPLVRRVFEPVLDNIRFDVMQLPAELHFASETDKKPIVARTLRYKTTYNLSEEKDLHYYGRLDEEAQYTADLADAIIPEIEELMNTYDYVYMYVPFVRHESFSESTYGLASRHAVYMNEK